jgi:DNA-directed RNA polymerase subunit beta'
MLASNNILNPKDGKPVVTPTQDIVIGVYYLTYVGPEDWNTDTPRAFSSPNEAQMAYELGNIQLHEKIKVRMKMTAEMIKKAEESGKETKSAYYLNETTVGRVIFNEIIPDSLGYYNETIDKKKLGNIVYECYRLEGNAKTAQMLDGMKRLGFRYSTRAGLSVGVIDFQTPMEKEGILATPT